jgi:hypothetical protein
MKRKKTTSGRGFRAVAAECIKTPRRHSVWCPENNEYVSHQRADATDRGPEADRTPADRPATPAPLSPQFKLVFLSAAGGTAFFVLLCVVVTLAAGGQPAPLDEELVRSLSALAQIGFGAVAGLLGSKTLH